MTQVSTAVVTDMDAAYVKGRLAEAERLDMSALNKSNAAMSDSDAARRARKEAGLRLIEVRSRLSQKQNVSEKGVSGTFLAWLAASDIPKATAYSIMKDAGFTEEQREEHRAKERERKNTANAKKRKDPGPKFPMPWHNAMLYYSGITKNWGGSQGRLITKQLGIETQGLKFATEDEAIAFAQKAVVLFIDPDKPRETLQVTDEDKVKQAVSVETAKLQASFWGKVREEAAKMVPDIKAKAEKQVAEAIAQRDAAYRMAKGVGVQMEYKDFQRLRSLLHPDRAMTTADQNEALAIVNKLEPYMEACREYVRIDLLAAKRKH